MIPTSLIVGPIIMVGSDLLARILTPSELPVGMVTAFIGAPLLIALVRRKGAAEFDTIAELGFVQFPPVAQLQAQGFFASVPVEKVTSLDSQVAVFSPIGMPLSQLQNDALLNSLPVVRDGRAIELAEDDPAAQAMAAGTYADVLSELHK